MKLFVGVSKATSLLGKVRLATYGVPEPAKAESTLRLLAVWYYFLLSILLTIISDHTVRLANML